LEAAPNSFGEESHADDASGLTDELSDTRLRRDCGVVVCVKQQA
jgi:hypothetical protein